MPPTIISIQSQVVHGHVGNSAAAFPMRVLGVEVAEVPTTLLSNHPHYPTTRGRVLEASLVADLLRGVEERGLIEAGAIVLSGYLGSAAIAEEVAAFVLRARRTNPRLIYLCDPVMGDSDIGFFVPADLQAAFRERLVPSPISSHRTSSNSPRCPGCQSSRPQTWPAPRLRSVPRR